MSLRSYSGIMMEAAGFALQDREGMLCCVTDPDDLQRTRHEIAQVKAIRKTLEDSRVAGGVPLSEIEVIAQTGDHAELEKRVSLIEGIGQRHGQLRVDTSPSQ